MHKIILCYCSFNAGTEEFLSLFFYGLVYFDVQNSFFLHFCLTSRLCFSQDDELNIHLKCNIMGSGGSWHRKL